MSASDALISVVIRTVGRDTLVHSIESAMNEYKNVIVVADAVDIDISHLPTGPQYIATGRKFDKYGSAAINMGAYACKTEFFCLLDDDDEFFPNAGNYMTSMVRGNPEYDIWIPGLRYQNGSMACMSPAMGVSVGNIAVPTYRTSLLYEYPFNGRISVEQGNSHWIDFSHVRDLVSFGYRINWYCKDLINIRPKLEGNHGFGA